MTFDYRDADGDTFIATNNKTDAGQPVVWMSTSLDGVYIDLDHIEEVVAGIRDAARTAARQTIPHACDNCDGIDPASCLANPDRAARQTTGQDDTGVTCAHCQGTGADPEDQGDYEPSVHMYNPTTIGPCPECHGTGKDALAVGQPAETHDTDRCASCDHQRTYHDVDGQCWFTVDWGRPGSNLVCPCAPRPNTVEDER